MYNDIEKPLVTFVSPCYNHSKFVVESLESIRKQDNSNIEHIIIDDASMDDSVTVIEKWIAENNYKCHFIKHKKNVGVSKTLNESLSIAKGKYWSPLATDDYIEASRTSVFVDFLEKNKNTNLVCSDCYMVDEHSEYVYKDGKNSFLEYYTSPRPDINNDNFGTYKSLLKGNYIPGSLLARKDELIEVGGFPEGFGVEDWDTWLRVSYKSKIALIDKKLTYYRWHEKNANINPKLYNDIIKTFLNQEIRCKKDPELYDLWLRIHKEFVEKDFSIWKKDARLLFMNKHQIIKTIKVCSKNYFKKFFK